MFRFFGSYAAVTVPVTVTVTVPTSLLDGGVKGGHPPKWLLPKNPMQYMLTRHIAFEKCDALGMLRLR